MRSYVAYIKSMMRLTARDRLVLFFNYLVPLVFFLGFGGLYSAKESSGAAAQLVAMVLVLGVLGTGFFGGGMRAVMDREAGILRRFKVAPITPAPILASSIVTGWGLFMPSAVLFVVAAHFLYGMPWPQAPVSLFVFLTVGVIAFRSVGLILASVVNSMQESQVIIQLLYLPMLMLSGATIPLSVMPDWLQVVAQFLPATHLYLGIQGILMRGEDLLQVSGEVVALVATALISLFVSIKLFRWEKEEKLKPSAKLWVVAALAPFLLAGIWQANTRTNLSKSRILNREMRRSMSWLVRDARIFTGDGKVIERGSVLVRAGKIEAVYDGAAPDAKSLNAEVLEAAGKTILPGFIDSQVYLLLVDGKPRALGSKLDDRRLERDFAAYLYCGVTTVRDATLTHPSIQAAYKKVETGEWLGPEGFPGSPADTTPMPALIEVKRDGGAALLAMSLVQQAMPPQLRGNLKPGTPDPTAPPLVIVPGIPPGSGSSLAPPLIHGPVIHYVLKLMVDNGIEPAQALRLVTSMAAERLGAGDRLGMIKPGYRANMVIVEGNPLEDISYTQRVWQVMSRGELIPRSRLFEELDDIR